MRQQFFNLGAMKGRTELLDQIQQYVTLTEQEQEEFASGFSDVFVKKKQQLNQPGFTPKYRYFVVSGALRSSITCKDGHDHTIQFAIENWWISDYQNYLDQSPAIMFLTAVEDSYVLQIDFETEQKLKASHHKFETIFRSMAEESTVFFQSRIASNLTDTAEVRYEKFLQDHPDIAQKVPQYALASYLGMTTEYLSRLRNKR